MRINEAFDSGRYVDMLFLIAGHLQRGAMERATAKEQRQALLSIDDFDQRLAQVEKVLESEKLKIKDLVKRAEAYRTSDQAKSRRVMPNRGRAGGADDLNEVEELKRKFTEFKLPEETQKIVDRELKKLSQLDPRNQEYHVSLNYLNTLSSLPWNTLQEENHDPERAQTILDRDHYGLEEIKKRIVQFLAVRKLKKNSHGSIICLYGPPGVGKTSLGKSIAEALNRKFYKIALGGVRDEAEIRGHRRTYVGSMPGVFIQSLIKIKTANPVFLLDEIDKMSRDGRNGDPGAALLEVLDPSQN